MNQPNNKSTTKLNHQQARDNRPKGGFIVVLIALTPLIFYLYKSFPDTEIWKTSFFEIKTGYGSWFNYTWYMMSKIVPLILLLVWFFTCRHWWHWIIIVPIAMYSFQLLNIVSYSQRLDEVEIFYILPLLMVIVPAVYLVRAKLFARIRGNDLESFEKELGERKSVWDQVKELFQ